MLRTLREDALTSTPTGFTLRLALPWIRSLPVSSVRELTIRIDGQAATGVLVRFADRWETLGSLGDLEDWWFVQDRLALRGDLRLTPGRPYDVAVSISLLVPYLQAGPDGPLILQVEDQRTVLPDAAPQADPRPAPVTVLERPDRGTTLCDGWQLAANSFNWTPEIARAHRSATAITVDAICDAGTAVIELEPGQIWRSFPEVSPREGRELRDRLRAAGGEVSIVGLSLDDWLPDGSRRAPEDRLAFLMPQLRLAQAVGASGVRLPIGQAGEGLLRRLVPVLDDLDLVLYEEIQGPQRPDHPGVVPAIDTIAALDSPRLRLLVDISMLMPALPTTYLRRLAGGGLPGTLLARLERDWLDPAVATDIHSLVRSRTLTSEMHMLVMNMLIRFGRSRAADLRQVMDLVGAFHLKFWDLDDSDGRVTTPVRDLAHELTRAGFTGTLCSEWGGHEWLDEDPGTMTRAHLTLMRRALLEGAGADDPSTTERSTR